MDHEGSLKPSQGSVKWSLFSYKHWVVAFLTVLTLALIVQKKCEWNLPPVNTPIDCILHPKHFKRRKKWTSLKTVLSEVLKFLILLKPAPWGYIFLILCDKMGSPQSISAACPRTTWSWGKAWIQLLDLQADPGTVSMECQMTDTLWLFYLGYPPDILKSEGSEPAILRKRIENIFCQ